MSCKELSNFIKNMTCYMLASAILSETIAKNKFCSGCGGRYCLLKFALFSQAVKNCNIYVTCNEYVTERTKNPIEHGPARFTLECNQDVVRPCIENSETYVYLRITCGTYLKDFRTILEHSEIVRIYCSTLCRESYITRKFLVLFSYGH